MTRDDVLAAADQLVQFHDRFAPLFGKAQAQDHAHTYLRGLLSCPERKGIEPIALCLGNGRVSGLQKFIAVAPWRPDDVQAVLPRASTWRVASLAMSFSVMIEISQSYHAPWIDSIRGTTLGALVLGHGFLWSDLACYAVGVGLGILIERVGSHDRPAPGT